MNPGPAGVRSCDVLVAGGGVAGVSAAISAARGGCSVILVEQHRQLGGTGTRGLLGSLCGLYLNADAAPRETLNKGIVREVVTALLERAPARTAQKRGRVAVLPYAPDELARVLDSLCAPEQDLAVLRGTRLVSADSRNGLLSEVGTEGEAGLRIRPRVAIDATGNGELGFLVHAGFDLTGPDERQMSGYTVRLRGLKDLEGLELKVPFVLAGIRDSRASSTLRFTTFVPGEEQGEGLLKFNSAEPAGPGRERQMQADVALAMETLAASLPAFRHAVVAAAAAEVLDREGRRLLGGYVLTEEDVLSASKFPDAAVRNAWPIELWDRRKGTAYRYVPKGEYYEIPFRCLTVKGFDNVLAAGRCISVSREALGSVRVMGCCMATGDAAGRAAACFVKSGEYGEYRLNA